MNEKRRTNAAGLDQLGARQHLRQNGNKIRYLSVVTGAEATQPTSNCHMARAICKVHFKRMRVS